MPEALVRGVHINYEIIGDQGPFVGVEVVPQSLTFPNLPLFNAPPASIFASAARSCR